MKKNINASSSRKTTSVPNMTKSNVSRVQSSALLLAQDAPLPSSIRIGKKSYKKDDVLKVLVLFFDCLCREQLSPDVTTLSAMSCAQMAEDIGIDREQASDIILWLVKKAEGHRKKNPLSGMF